MDFNDSDVIRIVTQTITYESIIFNKFDVAYLIYIHGLLQNAAIITEVHLTHFEKELCVALSQIPTPEIKVYN